MSNKLEATFGSGRRLPPRGVNKVWDAQNKVWNQLAIPDHLWLSPDRRDGSMTIQQVDEKYGPLRWVAS